MTKPLSDMITIGRCKHCRWRDADGYCTNDDKLHEKDYRERTDERDHLVYCYWESGGFWVGPDYGCVHWSNTLLSGTTQEGA